jgi:hypothetical protein
MQELRKPMPPCLMSRITGRVVWGRLHMSGCALIKT